METKRDNTSTILGMTAIVFLSIALVLILVFSYVGNKTAKAKVNTRTINGTYNNGTIVNYRQQRLESNQLQRNQHKRKS